MSAQCNNCEVYNQRKIKLKAFNFRNLEKNDKEEVKESRKDYDNLIEDRFKPKGGYFFRSFEKMYMCVFDHIVSYLKEVKERNSEKDLICDDCGEIVENQRSYSFTKLPEILAFGFDYESYDLPARNRLTTKIEETIDINPFVSGEEDADFEDSLREYNKKQNGGAKEMEKQEKNIYSLKGLIQLKENSISGYSYIQYVNIKGKWWVIEDGKQVAYTKALNFATSGANPIVFCYYERNRETNSVTRNIESQMKIKSSMKNEIELLSIPDDFVYKLLYTNLRPKPTLDFFFCDHKSLKPLYNDIYGFRKNDVTFTKPNAYPYSGKKKFNKELERYRIIKKNSCIGTNTPEFNQMHSTVIKKKNMLGFSNTFDLSNKNSENNQDVDCSFTRLYYLANSVDLPKPVAEYLIENYINSKRNLYTMNSSFYSQKCDICTKNYRRDAINRIIQKALFVDFLDKNLNVRCLIEINWFNRFKEFLLADLKNTGPRDDNRDQMLFEKFNKKEEIENREKILDEDNFVEIDLSTFLLLSEIYGCDRVVIKDSLNEKLGVSAIEDLKCDIKNVFNCNENFVFNLFRRFMRLNTLKPQKLSSLSNSRRNSTKNGLSLNNIDPATLDNIIFELYDELLNINKKMNVTIRNKIKNNFSVFESRGELGYRFSCNKNIGKIEKTFGSYNLDAVNFSPCQSIRGILEAQLKENQKTTDVHEELVNSISSPTKKRQSIARKSNIVNSIESENDSKFFDSPETNLKKMTKTKTYLENIELSVHRADNPQISKLKQEEEEELMKCSKIVDSEEKSEIMTKNNDRSNEEELMSEEEKPRFKLDEFLDNDDECPSQEEIFNKPKESVFKDKPNGDSVFCLDDPDFQDTQNDADITLNSISSKISEEVEEERSDFRKSFKTPFKEDVDALDIKLPEYSPGSISKPHKTVDKTISVEKSFNRMPSRKSHFSRLGSNFVVTDNSDSELDNISMNSNLERNMKKNLARNSKIARKNAKKLFRASVGLIEKNMGYVMKAKKKPAKAGFKLIINKKPKKKPTNELITFEDKKPVEPTPQLYPPTIAQPTQYEQLRDQVIAEWLKLDN